MKILQAYHCQDQIIRILTNIAIHLRVEHGQLRELLEVTDCRNKMFLGRFATKYFDAAFDVRWIRASKIIKPGESPGEDKLSIGVIAAEELTKEEFNKRLEDKALDSVLNEAKKIINPNKEKNE